MNIQKIMRDSERFLKRTEDYKDYQNQDDNFAIEYVIAKEKDGKIADVLAFARRHDEVLSFHPYRDNEVMYLDTSWSFDIDNDLFEHLENGYEIVCMPFDGHHGVWWTINEWHDGDINHVQGMQMYLGYCKRNGITMERMAKECRYEGMDVMTLYDGKTPANKGITKPPKEYER